MGILVDMAMQSSVGSSHVQNPFQAGVEAFSDAKQGLGDKIPEFGFIFSSVAFIQEEVLKGISSVSGDLPMVGCSTAGEITKNGPLPDSSVVVMLLATGGSMHFTPGLGLGIKNAEKAAGAMLANSVLSRTKKEDLKGFVMLPDGLAGNGAEIVRGVLSVLGDHFPVVGGSAGDDYLFKETYQYYGGEVRTGDVVGVGLSGDFTFGIGVKHGWKVLGRPAKVTRSVSNIVHEIDGRPAMELYEKYFGAEKANELRVGTLAHFAVSYPLGIKSENSEEYLIRDPLAVDENGSITCAAEIPEGVDVRIMMGTRESAIEMARDAAKQALTELGGRTPKAIFIFNCIARKKLLGQQGGEEIAAIQSVLGKDVPLIGFYTYGEQAPVDGIVKNIERCNAVFHNETVVIYVLAD